VRPFQHRHTARFHASLHSSHQPLGEFQGTQGPGPPRNFSDFVRFWELGSSRIEPLYFDLSTSTSMPSHHLRPESQFSSCLRISSCQAIRWGAYLLGVPHLDLCYGCGSAIDTIEEPEKGKDTKCRYYDKRTSICEYIKGTDGEPTKEQATMRQIILAASKVVLGEETSQAQGISPASAHMFTSVSAKQFWDVGFVSEEWWSKTQGTFNSCGIIPEYHFDEELMEWIPGFTATIASLDNHTVPYKRIRMSAKKKVLLDEELLDKHNQIRLNHARTVWTMGCKQLKSELPASVQGSQLEVNTYDSFLKRKADYEWQVEEKKRQRAQARREAELAVLGHTNEQTTIEPEAVVQRASAFAAMPFGLTGKGKPKGQEQPARAGARGQRLSGKGHAPDNLALPPGVRPPAPAGLSITVPPAAAAKGDGIVKSEPAAENLGKGTSGGGKRRLRSGQGSTSARAAKAPRTSTINVPTTKTEGDSATAAGSKAKRSSNIPEDVPDVDQGQFKDLQIMGTDYILRKEHVSACVAGWKGMKTVNAVPQIECAPYACIGGTPVEILFFVS